MKNNQTSVDDDQKSGAAPTAYSGEEIREGANEEDQLKELKNNQTSVDDDKKSGAAPTAYSYERKTTDDQGESS